MTLNASRREFLKRASALSIAGAGTPLALNLAALGNAAAANAEGYKALVCVYLAGGNDYANTVVPFDATSHALYAAQRPSFATAITALGPTLLRPDAGPATALLGGRQFALAPQLLPLMPLFDGGKLAMMLNMGTLVEPTTKEQYLNRLVQLPPKLFSHNDQTSVYLSSAAEGSVTGWGGRMGDLYTAAPDGNLNSTFTCISTAGQGVFLSGASAVPYQVTNNGAVPLRGLKAPLFGSAACSDALRSLVTAERSHLFEAEHTRVMRRSIEVENLLNPALSRAPASDAFPAGNNLAAQLSMVARMIALRGEWGAKRQVFFVSLGGFDTHNNLGTDHPRLLETVAAAMKAFHTATVELGVESNVTTFTASEFGRTLNSNGDGSDHGWGSMHMVLGGAVKGRSFHGFAPEPANNGPYDVGRGRLIPSLSIDQFGATLGRWFGVSDTELAAIFPNLTNFTERNLGFMA